MSESAEVPPRAARRLLIDLSPLRRSRIGDLEAGAVATAFGNTVSVVSGGLACIAGALVLARLLPGFRRQRMDPGGAGSG